MILADFFKKYLKNKLLIFPLFEPFFKGGSYKNLNYRIYRIGDIFCIDILCRKKYN